MDVLSTGIPLLDEALGGGLLEDSSLLVLYDTYSYGWVIAFEIMRNRMSAGDFGVIIDSVLPLSSLGMEVGVINFDIYKEGREGNLAIIDLFSSYYNVSYPEDFVYTDGSMDPSTFLPKYLKLYRQLLSDPIGDRRPIGVTVTVDGLAFLHDEESLIKTFQRLMAIKELARINENRKRPVNILLLNKGRASERLVSWMALYSNYVIDFISGGESTFERMFVRKSPLPDFKPKEGGYTFRLEGGKIHLSNRPPSPDEASP